MVAMAAMSNQSDSMLDVSIIIPAFNEAAEIDQTVAAAQSAGLALGRPYEIIVVNDASEDGTAELARQAGARVVDVCCRQIGATRNAGARAARGELLVFVDADTRLTDQTLIQAWQSIRRGCVGGGATVRFDEQATLPSHCAVAMWNMLSRMMRWAAGSFFFARRGLFLSVGGFDERYFAAEEIVLSEALKVHGPFAVVGASVTTSSRKERTHSWLTHFVLLAKVILSRGKALQKRDGLGLWYDGRRETA